MRPWSAFIFAGLLGLEPSALAGYMVVKTSNCDQASPCIEPPSVDDPNLDELYQIMLDKTWPTAPHPTADTEKADLARAVENSPTLENNYRFIWVPDTIADLHCASTLIMQKGRLEIPENDSKPVLKELADRQKHSIESASLRSFNASIPFRYNQNDEFQLLLERTGYQGDSLKHYFREYNNVTKNAFFSCNFSIAQFFENFLQSSSDNKKITVESAELIYNDHTNLNRLVDEVIQLYNSQIEIKGSDGENIISVIEVLTEDRPIIDRVIQLEIDGEKNNIGFLFRGTNGVSTLDGGLALDDLLSHETNLGYPLSFGSSLYSGLFRESWHGTTSGSGACAMNYIRISENFGYAIPIKKNDISIKELFEIPPFGLIGRLFFEGEMSHPRSKVGYIQSQKYEKVPGTYISFNNFQRLNLLVNSTKSSPELANKISDFIADNAIVLSKNRKIIDELSAKEVLSSQRTLSKRKFESSPDYINRIVDALVAHDNLGVLAAARREMGIYSASEIERNILPLLKHELATVRSYALSALTKVSPDQHEIHDAIAEALNDPVPSVKGDALVALNASRFLHKEIYLKIANTMGENFFRNQDKAQTMLLHLPRPIDPRIIKLLLTFLRDNRGQVGTLVRLLLKLSPDLPFLKTEEQKVKFKTYGAYGSSRPKESISSVIDFSQVDQM